jgi:hypothetical protein
MTPPAEAVPVSQGYREFEFDLPGALLDHLVRALDGMGDAPLSSESILAVPEAQGVYQLFLDGELVYIGKTDAESGLHQRLTRHSHKVQHRRGLDPARVTFKAIRIFVFTAMDLETQLIKHYGGVKGTKWNGSGFGANDPGRKRDHSEPGEFDLEFPIDIDHELDEDFSGKHTASAIAAKLKNLLPYTFRYETQARSRTPHADLLSTEVTVAHGPMTARRLIEELVRQLPPGWQATALSALLILYKEHEGKYPQATILARS